MRKTERDTLKLVLSAVVGALVIVGVLMIMLALSLRQGRCYAHSTQTVTMGTFQSLPPLVQHIPLPRKH